MDGAAFTVATAGLPSASGSSVRRNVQAAAPEAATATAVIPRIVFILANVMAFRTSRARAADAGPSPRAAAPDFVVNRIAARTVASAHAAGAGEAAHPAPSRAADAVTPLRASRDFNLARPRASRLWSVPSGQRSRAAACSWVRPSR